MDTECVCPHTRKRIIVASACSAGPKWGGGARRQQNCGIDGDKLPFRLRVFVYVRVRVRVCACCSANRFIYLIN